ncbi:hypothetical protein KQI68_07185 [Peptoniphilus sp. MSJ-1]|uniref:Uncharacterized protein n=1 Tax=Peptoniphilus ovalis TaxID=2841503 RepID=A0ABS6FHG9_9FIRM|nr:hypothetical protein [Peptoniphilus ovalis]MBU5669622.1 hypothetical protein [Peptoniphilus ovalis]
MDIESQKIYERGRRLVKELEVLISNYQKLKFYINAQDDVPALYLKQASSMRDYIDILLERIKKTCY